jgi:hypothetical protein
LIADEADRGVLFTVDHSRLDKNEIPIKQAEHRHGKSAGGCYAFVITGI